MSPRTKSVTGSKCGGRKGMSSNHLQATFQNAHSRPSFPSSSSLTPFETHLSKWAIVSGGCVSYLSGVCLGVGWWWLMIYSFTTHIILASPVRWKEGQAPLPAWWVGWGLWFNSSYRPSSNALLFSSVSYSHCCRIWASNAWAVPWGSMRLTGSLLTGLPL